MAATPGSYLDAYEMSVRDSAKFWLDASVGIDWVTPPSVALDETQAPVYRWFPNAELNTCFNAVDRHVANGRTNAGPLPGLTC